MFKIKYLAVFAFVIAGLVLADCANARYSSDDKADISSHESKWWKHNERENKDNEARWWIKHPGH
jgi:outer membrane murein-binding lipoprotein Lpp